MVVAPSNASGPRYAPADPTLPSPWRALVDGNTGYIYYWNTETNITQYERPILQPQQPPPPQAPPLPSGPPPMNSGPKLAPIPVGSSSASPSSTSSQVKHFQHDGIAIEHVNNANGNFAASKVGAPVQPKLAVLPVPRGHQGGQVFSAVPQATGGGFSSPNYRSFPQGTGPQRNLKRNADSAHEYHNQDVFKRPRTQAFCDRPALLDIEVYMKQNDLTVVGENVPSPFITFDAAGFPLPILRELQAAGFTSPTPIQAQSWPVALQNRDIVAIAKTGSGKTLGYLLPAFLHLEQHRNNARLGPTVLVLAPTRELATQIQNEAVKFGRSSKITSTCVYGGAPKGPQLRDIERGADVVIATPGRLNDFLEVKKVSLGQVSYLVLDEADRMLDMGFEPQIRKIVTEIRGRRQTLMYTATWPKEVRKIAADLLVNPVQVNVGNSDELSANKSITQYIEILLPQEKQRRLEQILRSQDPGSKIIIFCTTKKMCDQLARGLSRNFPAAAIHGDKSQTDRDWVLSQFKTGKAPVLVATDVAARGLDIKDIRVVINYDFPTGIEDYVHRIGRTGRAGATGLAYTFFLEQDAKYAGELIKVLEGTQQKVPPQLRDFVSRGAFMRGRGGRWDSGGRGRDAGRGSFGGHVEGFSGRGQLGTASGGGRFGNRDRQYNPFEGDKFAGRGNRTRPFGERDRGRDDGRRYSNRGRGQSFSHSYSRSPSRSRGHSYSRSPSRNHDSYDADMYRDQSRSPVRSPYRSKSPFRGRSPYRSASPPHHRSPHLPAPYRSSPRHDRSDDRAGASSHSSPPRDRFSYNAGGPRSSPPHHRSLYRTAAPSRRSPPLERSPYRSGAPYRRSPHFDRSPYRAAPSRRSPPLDRAGASSLRSPPHERSPYRAGASSLRSPPHERSPYRLGAPSRRSPPLVRSPYHAPSRRSPLPDRSPYRTGVSSRLSPPPDRSPYRVDVPSRQSPLPGRSPYHTAVPSCQSLPRHRSPYRADAAHHGSSAHSSLPLQNAPSLSGKSHSSPPLDKVPYLAGPLPNYSQPFDRPPYHTDAPSDHSLPLAMSPFCAGKPPYYAGAPSDYSPPLERSPSPFGVASDRSPPLNGSPHDAFAASDRSLPLERSSYCFDEPFDSTPPIVVPAYLAGAHSTHSPPHELSPHVYAPSDHSLPRAMSPYHAVVPSGLSLPRSSSPEPASAPSRTSSPRATSPYHAGAPFHCSPPLAISPYHDDVPDHS